jgi:hypothetical protein
VLSIKDENYQQINNQTINIGLEGLEFRSLEQQILLLKAILILCAKPLNL